ncbi:MAG: alpha-xylosidase [Dermatophilaceae bacterium]
MKFSDGVWLDRPGADAVRARWVHSATAVGDAIVILATPRPTHDRRDVAGQPVLRITLDVISEGVVRVVAEHHHAPPRGFPWVEPTTAPPATTVSVTDDGIATLDAGALHVEVTIGAPLAIRVSDGHVTHVLDADAFAHVTLDVEAAPSSPGVTPWRGGRRHDAVHLRARLPVDVGELFFGLGERFGPLSRNGQSVRLWNADGGTGSDQAYKNVPLLLSTLGYGIFVNDTADVDVEVATERVDAVQVSVPGERLELWLVSGPHPKDVLRRYTGLLGRPPQLPQWSFGLWLSTSFSTDYSESTVLELLDRMEQAGVPVSVFHVDCFWMKELQWCDFAWDERVFPDPVGMIERLHDRGVKVSVWVNPYISAHSPLFDQARRDGYLLTRDDGTVWQWDHWQPGMGILDLTNPAARTWFQGHLRRLLDQGVDTFKTDFGERIPLDVRYHDGSDPRAMHNQYAHLYNQVVLGVVERMKGPGQAMVFARSGTAGGQTMPVHWSGDSRPTYSSMAETLRGGLSLSLSGYAHWSHDIGGFEGTPSADLFTRWLAFGLLTGHSRMHGSESSRAPWEFGDTATRAAARYTRLKLRLLPYLVGLAAEAAATGIPLLRPMWLEYPCDPVGPYLDRQYLLGGDLLVAPVMRDDGQVTFYLPPGPWTDLLTGEVHHGGRFVSRTCALDDIPLLVRPGALLPIGSRDDSAEYDIVDDLTVRLHPSELAHQTERITVTSATGRTVTVGYRRDDDVLDVAITGDVGVHLDLVGAGPPRWMEPGIRSSLPAPRPTTHLAHP